MIEKNNLDILFVASEMYPFVKSGGLGDVIGSLPLELVNYCSSVSVILPYYKKLNTSEIKNLEVVCESVEEIDYRQYNFTLYKGMYKGAYIYLIKNDDFFGYDELYGRIDDAFRFAFFNKAIIKSLKEIHFKPDIINLNDWQTGLLAVYMNQEHNKQWSSGIKTVFSLHNIQYQGVFGSEVLDKIGLDEDFFKFDQLEYFGNINFMKAGLVFADIIIPVSETYAKEIQTSEYGYGLDGLMRWRKDSLKGIVNGINTEEINPVTNSNITLNYGVHTLKNKKINKKYLQRAVGLPEEEVPIIAIISRLVTQKGLELVRKQLLYRNIQFIILGTGQREYEEYFNELQREFPYKVSSHIYFAESFADQIYAGADMFLMPSLFEPCGLGQMNSMRYGTIPIVRKTGGLADTVKQYCSINNVGNGFLFEEFTAESLEKAVDDAIRIYNNKEQWQRLVTNAMTEDFSWNASAKKYVAVYEELVDSCKL